MRKLLIAAFTTAMLCPLAAQAREVFVAPGTIPLTQSPAVSNLISDALHFLNSGNPTGKPGPWCANFVTLILKRHGYKTVGSGMAADMRHAGRPTTPHPGAIAWNYRHAGFVLSIRGNELVMVSGNTHRGVVGISHFRVNQFNYVEPQHG